MRTQFKRFERTLMTGPRQFNRVMLQILVGVGPLGLVVMVSCLNPDHGPAGACRVNVAAPPLDTRVLVFTRTTGFRHGSIPAGVAAVAAIGAAYQFAVEHTEDAAAFADQNLERFAAVVFLNTTGDVLDDDQQAALERFLRAGGGFAGVHSAADTEYGWAWYGQLIGAYFKSHPAIQQATVRIQQFDHPATECLPTTWVRTDEWYDFLAPPPPDITVLATVDEATYQGGTMGVPHPIAWYHEFEGGRAWYTAMGHTAESYTEPAFLNHLAGGLLWVSGAHVPSSDTSAWPSRR